ncbi:hypothetical protein [Agrobacterium tumefaciens]|uniref:hypothetical protein n=1 Tax=Agrobacterium tumefaciens TaxID=358 RepID=UPI00287DC135|nr:hypothetical protein [Agrobacterium tumefaciens]MDS7598069.1 hypothetical protein [Agrobacterium tumefaciens]
MLQRRIAALALASASLVLASVPPASAENFGHRHYYRHHQQQTSFSTDGLPSTLPGGTYSGGIAALRIRGNGNYFAISGGLAVGNGTTRTALQPAPKAKIIKVNSATANAACTYEHGVCVIRP